MAPLLDFRSDTVTQPTPAMYEALRQAPLGDDVLGHDPTVLELEEETAQLLGKEAALFFPSGTMANQAAVRALTRDGGEILLGLRSHIFNFEVGGVGLHSRVQTNTVEERDGYLRWEDLAPRLRSETVHSPGTQLICLENTHNILGGRLFPLPAMEEIAAGAAAAGIPVHLDGARLFNASIASRIPAREYAACATTVMTCLSKGLASPVGSMLAGPADLMERCRRIRKSFGGGLRQSGILAACGLVSLRSMVDRLADDHANARQLAEGLNQTGLVKPVALSTVQTNIIIAELAPHLPDLSVVQQLLSDRGLLVTSFPPRFVRLCTHKDVDQAAVQAALQILFETAGSLASLVATA